MLQHRGSGFRDRQSGASLVERERAKIQTVDFRLAELSKLGTLASTEYLIQESFFVQVFLPFSMPSDAF